MRARSRMPLSKQGFTGIEMIAVLVVLGIFAVVLAAGLDVHASVAVEADILRSHLGYAQSLAMANNTADWSVSFGGNAYTLVCTPTPDHLPPWPNESSSTHALPAGVTLVSGAGVVAFDEWGAPAATHTLVLSDGTQQQPVTITGFTGLVP